MADRWSGAAGAGILVITVGAGHHRDTATTAHAAPGTGHPRASGNQDICVDGELNAHVWGFELKLARQGLNYNYITLLYVMCTRAHTYIDRDHD